MLQFIYSKSSLSLIEMMALAISVTQDMFLISTENIQSCINTYNAELTLIVFICVQLEL